MLSAFNVDETEFLEKQSAPEYIYLKIKLVFTLLYTTTDHANDEPKDVCELLIRFFRNINVSFEPSSSNKLSQKSILPLFFQRNSIKAAIMTTFYIVINIACPTFCKCEPNFAL